MSDVFSDIGDLYTDILPFGIGDHFKNKKNMERQDKANEQNAALQREFAQNGITWRVQDAARVGLSPLAALGTQGASASPSFVAGSSNFGDGGQDLSRAILQTQSPLDRAQSLLLASQTGKTESEKELVDLQAAKLRQELGPPGPGGRDTEGGTIPEAALMRGADGNLTLVPSQDFANRSSGNLMASFDWWWRNGMLTNWRDGGRKVPGYKWNTWKGVYEPVKGRK